MADLAYTHGVWRQTLQGLHKTRKNFIDPEIHLTTEKFKRYPEKIINKKKELGKILKEL